MVIFTNYIQSINKKTTIGLSLLIFLSILIWIVPEIIGFDASISLRLLAIVLLSIYVVLAFEFVHRTVIVLVVATIAITIGITTGLFQADESLEFVVQSIDFNTIGLLLGMMIIVIILAETGIFQYIGIKMGKASKGNMWKLLVMMSVFTAVTSMFIDNVTTILLMIPVTISIFKTFRMSPIPFILAQVLASNIGGTATLIGDPPNIMIGSAANIDFNSFLIHMGPTITISLIASLILFKVFFRKELKATPQNLDEIMSQDEMSFIKDRPLLIKSLSVLFGVIVLFAIHGILHIEPSFVALGGAGVLLLIAKIKPEKILHDVDWSTLIFFACLFITITIAKESGMIDILAKAALGITAGNAWASFFMVIWVSAIASAFVDNIPFAVTMIPLIEILNQNSTITSEFQSVISPLWWALSLGVGFGGNGTLIGSSAGVIAIGLAEKYGYKITFMQFFKIGFPFMIITVAVGSIVLMIDLMLKL
ncbi:MAG: rane protein [Nitrosarchaeum sp.]|jgi:Na+/H+ antiporter NhaD/arsenite permease-like protein|nr:rane protein [Nitrosarchaeum sp.]